MNWLTEKLLYIFTSEEYVLKHRVEVSGAKEVVLFGANNVTQRLICLLSKINIKVLYIVDRNSSNALDQLQGCPIKQNLDEDDKDTLVVVCALKVQLDIIDYLRVKDRRGVSLDYRT